MRRLGDKLARGIRELREAMETGKPLRQTVVRRVMVKGKTVHTRETFTAPLKLRPRSK